MEELPTDLLINEIVPRLAPSTLSAFLSTCRSIWRLAKEESFWIAYLASYDYKTLQSMLINCGENGHVSIVKGVLGSDKAQMVDDRTIEMLYYWSVVNGNTELISYLIRYFDIEQSAYRPKRIVCGQHELNIVPRKLLPISSVHYTVECSKKVRSLVDRPNQTNEEIRETWEMIRECRIDLTANGLLWAPSIDRLLGILITSGLTCEDSDLLLWERTIGVKNRSSHLRYSITNHSDIIAVGLVYHNNVPLIRKIFDRIDLGNKNPFSPYVDQIFSQVSSELFKELNIDLEKVSISSSYDREIWKHLWDRSFTDLVNVDYDRERLLSHVYRSLSPKEALAYVNNDSEKRDSTSAEFEQMITRGLDLYSTENDRNYRTFTMITNALKDGYSYWAAEAIRLISK